jgi:hypothetical protein
MVTASPFWRVSLALAGSDFPTGKDFADGPFDRTTIVSAKAADVPIKANGMAISKNSVFVLDNFTSIYPSPHLLHLAQP